MSRTLLIVGTALPDRLEGSYTRAFKQLGWSVQIYDPLKALHKVSRGRGLGRLFSTFVQVEPWLRKSNVELLGLINDLRPDLTIVVATDAVRGGTLAQIKVRVPGSVIFCVYPDSPHNLNADHINCLPFFDLVTTSSPAWTDAFERLGARRVRYLPFAADTEMHRPAVAKGKSDSIFADDVAFIGTWRAEREAFFEQFADFNLRVWGNDYWKRRTRADSPLRACWSGRPIVGEEFAQVCTHSKILFNVLDAQTWPGPNMRSFEQPACGAFSLVTRTDALLEIFTEGESVECFDSVEEAREKIRYYLTHETERRKIAAASYKLVVEGGHTYLDRARQLIEWMNDEQRAA